MREPSGNTKPNHPHQRVLAAWAADRRAAVAPVLALTLVVLIGITALVIDLGQLFVIRGELQNASDSAALAGVVELVYTGLDGAEETAVAYATKPEHYRLGKPPPGPDGVEVSYVGPETLQVRVLRTAGTSAGAVNTIFAQIWGIENAGVEALAVATLEHGIIGTGPGNLLPFGIRKALVDADGDGDYDIGNSIDIYPHTESPGNFGLLDLNGGSNSNAETLSWIENGFDDIFIIPESTGGYLQMEGDPGISGDSVSAAASSRVGQRLLFPVFDMVSGQGATTTFRVIDLVGGVITDVNLTGSEENRRLVVRIEKFASTNLIVGAEGTPNNSSIGKPILIR